LTCQAAGSELHNSATRAEQHPEWFWRTKTGLEVDFVLGRGEVAVEVKGTDRVDPAAFRPLRAFVEEHRPRRSLIVCNERSPRVHESIEVLPWRVFLDRLWSGDILS
jgi:predicted AAA+ superfamily ATPase